MAKGLLDTYWTFIYKRQEVYERRLVDRVGPWSDDPILQKYRFTNVFRASDRVSQYLINEVIYNEEYSQDPDEVFFRVTLFKMFNKIETWERLSANMNMKWAGFDIWEADRVLTEARKDFSIYSAAYIIPNPPFGAEFKHTNHLLLLNKLMQENMPLRLTRCKSLKEVYELLMTVPGFGKFLAFQHTIDLNYSEMINFDENEFVVAGPGALDGISKCFPGDSRSPEEIIRWCYDQQQNEFDRCGLDDVDLFRGREPKLIDLQNCFCEISKYTRMSNPEVAGVAGRTTIKQNYKPLSREMPIPDFPPKWEIDVLGNMNLSFPPLKNNLELFF